MQKLEVGKHLKKEITQYREGIKFDIDDNGANLFIYFNNPTNEEIKEITKGYIKLGYYKEGNVILMLFKFGNQQWMDAPYSIHLSKNLSTLQEVTEGKGYAVNVYLVNASNGILEGIRLVGMNNRISKMLREDLIKQKEMSFENYDINLQNIFRKYSTRVLVSMSKVVSNLE